MSKQVLHTDAAPKAIGPYAQAVVAGGMLYTSGQLGVDPATGALADGAAEQTRLALRNIGAILASAGLSYTDVVKTTVFLANMDDFAAVNGVYEGFFTDAYPARSCVQVARLPKGGAVEIECVACLREA